MWVNEASLASSSAAVGPLLVLTSLVHQLDGPGRNNPRRLALCGFNWQVYLEL